MMLYSWGIFDGAFPADDWYPFRMKNISLYPKYPLKYLSGFWTGKLHRYKRWKKGYESDPF
jgi:hypothetical protein